MVCNLCGKPRLRIIRRRLRYGVRRNVLQCSYCDLVFLQPRKRNLNNYYSAGEYRKRHSPVIGKKLTPRGIFNIYFPFQDVRIRRISKILKPGIKAIEVGCSSGFFLAALKKYVKECVGVELNKQEAHFVNKVLKIKVYTSPIEQTDIPLGYFDLLCSFAVLEHQQDPLHFLKILSRYLKPKGYLYIEVPNVWDSLISVYKNDAYSEFMFLEPHLFYFSPKTLSVLLDKAGFTGKIISTQNYNFLNHLNWILTGKPQASASIGMSEPMLAPVSGKRFKEARQDINRFIKQADLNYRSVIERHGLGDTLVFIGQKKA